LAEEEDNAEGNVGEDVWKMTEEMCFARGESKCFYKCFYV
jgi:hypothetical protein